METAGWNPFWEYNRRSSECIAPFVFNIDQFHRDSRFQGCWFVPEWKLLKNFSNMTSDDRLMKLLVNEIFIIRIINQSFYANIFFIKNIYERICCIFFSDINFIYMVFIIP